MQTLDGESHPQKLVDKVLCVGIISPGGHHRASSNEGEVLLRLEMAGDSEGHVGELAPVHLGLLRCEPHPARRLGDRLQTQMQPLWEARFASSFSFASCLARSAISAHVASVVCVEDSAGDRALGGHGPDSTSQKWASTHEEEASSADCRFGMVWWK